MAERRADPVGALAVPPFCGRPIEPESFAVLQEIVASCALSRHELARTVCEALGWVRPSGRLKARECYEYLELLDAGGLIHLPARREQRRRGPTSVVFTEASRERPSRRGTLSEVTPVSLGLVANAEDRATWRELVARHHYLGHKVAYGAHLRYLVWLSKPSRELAGCLQFSSAARRLAARDQFIGWDDATRQHNLGRIVCNSRFLILPWLSIQGLASHVLSLAARVVADDWEEAYAVRPVALETFVDRERYDGTCYRAANWVEVGETTGRGRMDRDRTADPVIKTCLLYPLVSNFRRRLGVVG